MSEPIETNTNRELIREGFQPWEVYFNSKLPEELTSLALDIARKKYSDIRILPLEIALSGKSFRPYGEFKDSHILYVKLSDPYKQELDKQGVCGRVTMIHCEDIQTGEIVYFRLEDLVKD